MHTIFYYSVYKVWCRDDREWLFTFPFPLIPMQSIPIPSHSHSQFCNQFPFPWDSHGTFPILSHSRSRKIVSSLRHKHFLAHQELRPNTQYYTVLSMLCLSLNLTSNLIKAHITCATAAVLPARVYSVQKITSCFEGVTKSAAAVENWKKLNPLFTGSGSFNVTDGDTIQKLITRACNDKQHVCAYLQLFKR